MAGLKFTADRYAVYKWLGWKYGPSPQGEGLFRNESGIWNRRGSGCYPLVKRKSVKSIRFNTEKEKLMKKRIKFIGLLARKYTWKLVLMLLIILVTTYIDVYKRQDTGYAGSCCCLWTGRWQASSSLSFIKTVVLNIREYWFMLWHYMPFMLQLQQSWI